MKQMSMEHPLDYLGRWTNLLPELLVMRDRAYNMPGIVLPPEELCLRAFQFFYPEDTRAVILGQDPYHTPGKASGLAFGYNKAFEGKPDASMKMLLKELGNCNLLSYEPDEKHGAVPVFDYSLESWARQGILLLNTKLTVLEGQPLSHAGIGWEDVVGKVLKYLLENVDEVTYMLWGKEALHTYAKALLMSDPKYHVVLPTSHPSPLSATRGVNPFVGSKQFLKVPHINWGK